MTQAEADSCYADSAAQMSQQYADDMQAVFRPWGIGVWAIAVLIPGYVGGLIGVRAFGTHFARGGLA